MRVHPEQPEYKKYKYPGTSLYNKKRRKEGRQDFLDEFPPDGTQFFMTSNGKYFETSNNELFCVQEA
jgi:hypothetical protein